MSGHGGLWRGYLERNVAIINRKISRDRCTPVNRRGSERKSKQNAHATLCSVQVVLVMMGRMVRNRSMNMRGHDASENGGIRREE